jgi:hypothetical protein
MPATTTTPVKQKAAALKAAAAKKADVKKSTAKKPARDRSRWEGLTKGKRVKLLDGRTGVAAYFHTHYGRDKNGKDDRSKPIGMVGVLLDPVKGAPAKLGGRTVKHVSVEARSLDVIK